MKFPFFIATVSILALSTAASAKEFTITGNAGTVLKAETVAEFDEPWAMTFLPDDSVLVSTKPGRLYHVEASGKKHRIKGLPKVDYGGQGGFGDVILHPDFASNQFIYISYVDGKGGKRGAVVARAKLDLKKKGGGKLKAFEVIWKQKPKVSGKGHYSHRLVFGPKGSPHEGKIFITSGDRQKQSPAQDMGVSLGKIIRLNDDGSMPADNPWADGSQGKRARGFWSVGHRNMLGIAFDAGGQLWATEMGPRHGDELNLIKPALNYGWPIVSNGDNYSGREIPDHDTRPEFEAPKAYWVPSIAPAGMTIYSGDVFDQWKGDAFIAGLVSRALIRVDIDGTNAKEAERFEWGKRVREVEQGPKGALWVLEDKSDARLLKLTP